MKGYKLITLGVNKSPHNASVALLENEKVIFHIESERLTGVKYDGIPFSAIREIVKYVDHIDNLAITGLSSASPYDKHKEVDAYSATVMSLGKTFFENKFEVYDFGDSHHDIHAFTSFYNSGFSSALCVVKDGVGSNVNVKGENFLEETITKENGSAYTISYPHNIETIDKHLISNLKLPDGKYFLNDYTYITNSFSEAAAFEQTALRFGMTVFDAGKVMGMSAYGKSKKFFDDIYKDGLINQEVFSFNGDNLFDYNFKLNIEDNFQEFADFSYALQTKVQENVSDYILSLIEKTGQKNICLSGGFFLNCVSNYHLLKKIPKGINIYVEPICTDAGNAIGAAKLAFYLKTQENKILPQDSLFYGIDRPIRIENVLKENVIMNVTPYDVAKIISEKNVVAIFQGRSESGPRALGNRSILYDPRDPDAKEKINKIKKREWFRPFAASVLQNESKEWFEMNSLSDSKFMMFAVNVLSQKRKKIPGVVHVDGTCRIQTVDKEDNENFFLLIQEFFKITDVPVLFNTSFNLAGDTIVETLDDAIDTFHRSDIQYLYLPEIKTLIYKEKDNCEKN